MMMVGLHKGSVLSPYLFHMVTSIITEDIKKASSCNTNFEDGLVLCASNRSIKEGRKLVGNAIGQRREDEQKSAEYMSFNEISDGNVNSGTGVEFKLKFFQYLGSAVSADGELDEEIFKRIQTGWMNCKLYEMLCNRISARKKGTVFKVTVRPSMSCRAETWNIKRPRKTR